MSGLVDTLRQITTVIYPNILNIQSQSAASAQDAAASAQDAATLAAGIAAASAEVATAKAAGDNIKDVIYPDIQNKLIEATQKIAEVEEMIRVSEISLISIVGADLDISTFLADARRDADEIAEANVTVTRLIGELSALTGGLIGGFGGGVGGDCDDGVIYTYPNGQGAINKFKPEAHEHCDLISRAEFERKLTDLKFFSCYEKAAANLLPKAGGVMSGDLEFAVDGFAILDSLGVYWMIVVGDDGALVSISGAVLALFPVDTPIVNVTNSAEVSAYIAQKISLLGDVVSSPLFFSSATVGVVCFDLVGVSWRSTIDADGALVSQTVQLLKPPTIFDCGQISYSADEVNVELSSKANKGGDLISGDIVFGLLSGALLRSPSGYLFRLGIDASGAYTTTLIN